MKCFAVLGWLFLAVLACSDAKASVPVGDPRESAWGEDTVTDEFLDRRWISVAPKIRLDRSETVFEFSATWVTTLVAGSGPAASVCPDVRRGAAEAKTLLAAFARLQTELNWLLEFRSPTPWTTARTLEVRNELEELNIKIGRAYPAAYENRDRALGYFWSVDPKYFLAPGFELLKYVFVPASMRMSDYAWNESQGPMGAELVIAGEEPFLRPVGPPILHPNIFFMRPTSANRVCLGDSSLVAEGKFVVHFKRTGSSAEETRSFSVRFVYSPES